MSRITVCSLSLLLCLLSLGCGAVAIRGAGTVEDPVQFPRLAGPVKLDGDAGEWARIGPMPMPFMKKCCTCVRMAWRDEGLYGIVQAADKKIQADEGQPWSADSFELFLDKDCSRGAERNENSAQYVFCPTESGKEGPGVCLAPDGHGDWGDGEGLACAWKKTAKGYVLEFFIPASLMKPAKMAAGTKIGLNFVLNDDGEPTRQFFSDKRLNDGFNDPSTWGGALLAK